MLRKNFYFSSILSKMQFAMYKKKNQFQKKPIKLFPSKVLTYPFLYYPFPNYKISSHTPVRDISTLRTPVVFSFLPVFFVSIVIILIFFVSRLSAPLQVRFNIAVVELGPLHAYEKIIFFR